MRKKEIIKPIITCILTAALLLTGVTGPATVNAAENSGEVIYDDTVAMKDYWGEEEKKAPVKEGYVFGGWYKDVDGTKKAITQDEAGSFEGQAYAKFVPAFVLSVKAQIEVAAETGNSASTYLRLITSVDSTKYQNLGFDIWLNNATKVEGVPVITKVYDSVSSSEGKITAADGFGAPSAKLATLRLRGISSDNFRKIIYVRPYWTTMDGTKVEGLARYVRVEDGFIANRYISIPINLLEPKQVAAGIVEFSYKDYQGQLEIAKDSNGNYLIDSGRVLPFMEYHVDEENGLIRFVGNGTVNEYKDTETLYANVRFRVKDGASIPDSLLFRMQEGMFCDWKEQPVTVNAQDYQY